MADGGKERMFPQTTVDFFGQPGDANAWPNQIGDSQNRIGQRLVDRMLQRRGLPANDKRPSQGTPVTVELSGDFQGVDFAGFNSAGAGPFSAGPMERFHIAAAKLPSQFDGPTCQSIRRPATFSHDFQFSDSRPNYLGGAV